MLGEGFERAGGRGNGQADGHGKHLLPALSHCLALMSTNYRYMESADFGTALGMFSQSRDEFDVWFKGQLADVTGVDLNTPPPGPLSELLSHYEA